MRLGRAKAIISSTWLFLGVIIYLVVIYLTIIGKFKFAPGDWDAGLAWISPLILPVLGFILPTWTLTGTRRDRVELKHMYVFFFAIFLSLLYLLALFFVLWRLPEEIHEIEEYVNQVMRTSSWYLGTFQALILIVIGKFYLEEVHEE